MTNTIKLELILNNNILASLRYSSSESTPLDIQYIFNEFVKQINNILENGYYGEKKLKETINSGKFIGFDNMYK